MDRIALPDGELGYLDRLPLPMAPEEVLQRLIAETAWRAETITVFGKRHLQPRLTAWHGDRSYTYSGLTLDPQPWTPLLLDIKAAVEAASGAHFNSVLLNYYRNGRDSMGMHSDDEPELGPAPVIASVSFGEERHFILRHRTLRETRKFLLASGSLLVMRGATQQHWLHGINKSARTMGPRLNLTFRNILR
ncbi:MAG TPA: alpha-ketoglutarate-dependent dioxygenase AlkB [Ramlibacter sp.]|nr:alpha-ketoglutarate-dependent dioxygenase AlkB [Ramlibacter sp.]